MNGHAQAAASAAPTITSPLGAPGAEGTAPLITVNQLSLTGTQIRNLLLGLSAILGLGGAGGYFVLPWPDKADVKRVEQVVQRLETEGAENRRSVQVLAEENRASREAIRQLTDAVRAVNETVIDMRIAVEARPEVTPPVVRVTTPRPRRPRPPLPAPALTPPTPAKPLTPGG